MSQDRIGKYELRGTLGRGAMGIVYDGWDPAIARRVAIKTVTLADAAVDAEAAEGLARFRREAQAAGRLSHANIVGVFDTGETETLAYIVMEFIEGRSLKDVVDQEKSLPADEAADIMRQVLAGLEYSHRRDVIHRDIKPANIMVMADGGIKIADFGIARIANSTATAVGSIMGTPAYMPPEQFLGEPVDARSDIYAAGATLFHLLTGTRPFEGNPTSIMTKVLNADAAPLPSERSVSVSPAWDRVIGRAMARRPDGRYESAAEFAAAIREAVACRGTPLGMDIDATMLAAAPRSTAPSAQSAALRKMKRLSPMRLGGGIAVFLVVGAVGWLALTPSPIPQSPEDIRHRIAIAADAVPCSFVEAVAEDHLLAVRGIAGAGLPEDTLRKIAAEAVLPVSLDLLDFSGPYCAPLELVRPLMRRQKLGFSVPEAYAPIKDHQLIHPTIKNLPFDAWLQIDYFSSDGTVFHVFPMAGNARMVPPLPDDPSRLMQAGSTVTFGGGGHNSLFPVSPFGIDMIVAVASSQKLFAEIRPQGEAASTYLKALRTQLDMASLEGTRLAAGVVLISTIEK